MKKQTTVKDQPSNIWIGLLLLASFWIRLHALLELPGFIDEGNHLRWASEVWQGRWVFPLASGKPLLIYYLALFLPFPAPLWLGRAASVLTGVVILSGLYALGRKWNRQTGIFAALCYALMPWTFFHERLAVADSLVAACAVVMMVSAFQHVKRPSLITTIFLTVSMIALPMAKLSAATLLVMPLVVALIDSDKSWRISTRKLFLTYIITILFLIAILGYANLRYSVGQEVIQRAGFGQRTLLEWWGGNTSDVIEWAESYLDVISWLIPFSIFVAILRRETMTRIILVAFFFASGTYIFAPSTAYPRYYLSALAYGSLLIGNFLGLVLSDLPRKISRYARHLLGFLILLLVALVLFFIFIKQSYAYPTYLPLPLVDRQQHMSGWSSGYGIREGMIYLSDESKKESEPSIVYVSDLAGMVTARLYWTGNGQVLTLWDATMGAGVDDVANRVASGKPTFLLVDTDHYKANFVGLEVNPYELGRFRRPFDGKPIIVYRLKQESFRFPPD